MKTTNELCVDLYEEIEPKLKELHALMKDKDPSRAAEVWRSLRFLQEAFKLQPIEGR